MRKLLVFAVVAAMAGLLLPAEQARADDRQPRFCHYGAGQTVGCTGQAGLDSRQPRFKYYTYAYQPQVHYHRPFHGYPGGLYYGPGQAIGFGYPYYHRIPYYYYRQPGPYYYRNTW